MSSTPSSNPSSAVPGSASEKPPGSDTVSQHVAGDHIQGGLKDGAQVGSQDEAQRAKDPKWLASYLRRYSPDKKCSKKEVTAVLDLCGDDQACDTVMVCYFLKTIFGTFSKCTLSKEDMAEVVKARYDPKHSFLEAKQVSTVLKGLWCLPKRMEMFGARRREERWLKVQDDYRSSENKREREERWLKVYGDYRRSKKERDEANEGDMDEADEEEVDESDKELNCALAIWIEAQKTLADLRKNKV